MSVHVDVVEFCKRRKVQVVVEGGRELSGGQEGWRGHLVPEVTQICLGLLQLQLLPAFIQVATNIKLKTDLILLLLLFRLVVKYG